jgi:truncated hemoglobin YjbI
VTLSIADTVTSLVIQFGMLVWLGALTLALPAVALHAKRTRDAIVAAQRGRANPLNLPPLPPGYVFHAERPAPPNATPTPPTGTPLPTARRPGDLVAPAPTIAGDTVRDWLKYYTLGKVDWTTAVDELYRRAAADPSIASYFTGVDLDTVKRHFVAFMVMVTSKGLTADAVRRMSVAHAAVRNEAGLEITGMIYDRVIDVLVAILTGAGVPDEAINQLKRVVDPLRAAIVVTE